MQTCVLRTQIFPQTSSGRLRVSSSSTGYGTVSPVANKTSAYATNAHTYTGRKLAAPKEFDKPSEDEKRAVPPAYHRLVQMAPDGINKTLYIASHARRVVGMPATQSTRLLKYLLDHAENPKYQLAVRWNNIGDLVQWDNRCTMHKATAFNDQENRRDMRRTTVFDHGPNAFGVRLSLSAGDVDWIVGGDVDISAEQTPETREQEQISAL